MRSAVAAWYNRRPLDELAFQMVKYQNREGFSHRDALRLAHVHPIDGAAWESTRASNSALESTSFRERREALYGWAAGKMEGPRYLLLPDLVQHLIAAQTLGECGYTDAEEATGRRRLATVLPREALPTEWLNDPAVWESLLYGSNGRGMPLGALLRNLATMTRRGVLTATSDATKFVVMALADAQRIRKSRLHPMAIYLASKVYAGGKSLKGSSTWAPVGAITDALERAFLLAFDNVVPTNEPMIVAVDASGSMDNKVLGYDMITAREAGVAMAYVTVMTEPNARLLLFTDGGEIIRTQPGTREEFIRQHGPRYGGDGLTREFPFSRDERFRDLWARINNDVSPYNTDCAQPILWAEDHKFAPSAIVIYTDSETFAGNVKVTDALTRLRNHTRKNVRFVVAATAPSGVTIADPDDRYALQVVGFDEATPGVIADFVAGGKGRAPVVAEIDE